MEVNRTSSCKPNYSVSRDGHPFLLGEPALEKRALFGLEVGSLVHSIGCLAKSGKQTSASRITRFQKPATYAGLFKGLDEQKETLYAAFLLHPSEVTGWSLFNQPQPFFMLWCVLEDIRELLLQDFYDCTIRIHRGIFNDPDRKEVAHV
ncbi:hypothetical protein [Hymenobacter fodinae]|uniref:Uncharacterized protein n=1 Tax=Hymenobacter fodinae TaxID=2510796 RepID=A0A4Z0P5Q3_9BACT|nr:hypothetical protein [Hymenobacter fodinae]TGE07733.1 hypothetical protein EU556_08240 [Hymenobacter fodinae]